MNQGLLFLVSLSAMLISTGKATVVILSTGLPGPRVFTTSGQLVTSGLIRIGSLLGVPENSSFAAIDAAFLEFDTITTTSDSVFFPGAIGGTGSSLAGTPFNQLPVALWIFDGATAASSAEHALITVAANPPSTGDPWIFPSHIGSGLDSVTLSTFTLLADGESQYTPGVVFDSVNARIILTPIPEPSSAILLAAASVLLTSRRRRKAAG